MTQVEHSDHESDCHCLPVRLASSSNVTGTSTAAAGTRKLRRELGTAAGGRSELDSRGRRCSRGTSRAGLLMGDSDGVRGARHGAGLGVCHGAVAAGPGWLSRSLG